MRLLILGAGGHAQVVADAALSAGPWTTVDALDDDAGAEHGCINSIVGTLADVSSMGSTYDGIALGFGDSVLRRKAIEAVMAAGMQAATIIHPTAIVARHTTIGPGTVVLAGAVVNTGTTVGPACVLNTRSSVDHHCSINALAHVAPGATLGGRVSVGEAAWIGMGAVIRDGTAICAQATIGAGAVVVNDVDTPGTWIGVPATLLRQAQP
ncbi:MAG: acetyltransferase [Phycisphaerales bacterium]|nr:acetyltransferase [Phycisphaerales bacterium]